MIDAITSADSLPVLERLMQFAGQRHRIITHNVANLSTPGFRPLDVSVEDFQAQLGKAIDGRRDRYEPVTSLSLESTEQVEVHAEGLTLHPAPEAQNVLFHDQNDRDVERIMQDLVENFMTFRTAAELYRSRINLLNTAIAQRI